MCGYIYIYIYIYIYSLLHLSLPPSTWCSLPFPLTRACVCAYYTHLHVYRCLSASTCLLLYSLVFSLVLSCSLSLFICVYICIYMFLYVYVYVYMCVIVCVQICKFACVHVYVCVCIWRACGVHVFLVRVCKYVYVSAYMHVCVCICVHICACVMCVHIFCNRWMSYWRWKRGMKSSLATPGPPPLPVRTWYLYDVHDI